MGVTGSVGQSAMDVILSAPEDYDVLCVTAGSNAELLAESAIKLSARKAIIRDEDKEDELHALLDGHFIEVEGGEEALENCANVKQHLILAAITGFAGLKPIIKGLEQGTNIAIANKEPLVAAGAQIMELAKRKGATILPVDSEHNAVFQVFEPKNREAIDKIILTASGGPFLETPKEEMDRATQEQALAHPNWSMGKKISIDSATMMNKALEIIEAHHLFDMPGIQIEVVIHPQSIVHSMVSYIDGSVLTQMGASDMRTPIAYALGWPERVQTPGETLDLKALSELTFEQPDFEKFPALRYAYRCMDEGQAACICLNAANEVAVEAFLSGRIGFGDIMELVRTGIDEIYPALKAADLKTIEDIVELDNTVRGEIKSRIETLRAA